MTTSLVTGAAGFIGSHLTRLLADRGHQVLALDDLSGGFVENVDTRAVFLPYDIRDTRAIDAVFRRWKPDYIFHFAAYAAEGLSHWVRRFNYETNVIGSVNLINAAVRYGCERFIFASSMAVYGDQEPPFTEDLAPRPADPYGVAKHAVEQDLAQAGELFGLEWTVFRPHNVYGPAQSLGDPYRNVVGIFMRQAMAGEPLTIFGDGTQQRAFSYIDDVAAPIVASIDRPVSGQVFNIGGEGETTILDLAHRVGSLAGDYQIVHMPPRHEVHLAWCDHTKSRQELGFEPTVALDDGLERMWKWANDAGVRWSQTPTLEITENLPEFWR